ncbi:MAG: hypothetical protein LBJ87_16235 [bacterium]|nr:hypothetical protein [bacterium]
MSEGFSGQSAPGAACSARHPIGRQRCQLPLGHDGNHVAPRAPEHFSALRISWKQGMAPSAVENVEQYRRALLDSDAVRVDATASNGG